MEWTDVMMAVAPVAGSVALWMVRLEKRVTVHEAEDKLIHEHVQESLNRIEQKVDVLVDRHLSSHQ